MDKSSLIGKVFGDVEIVSFEGNTSAGTPQYKVRFIASGNVVVRTLPSIKKGLKDTAKQKATTKKQYTAKIKERGASTIEQDEQPLFGYVKTTENILVLDQASVSTGYCVVSNGVICNYGKITQKGDNHYIRIFNLIQDIATLVKQHKITSIIAESIYLGFNPKTYRILSEVIGALSYFCIDNGLSLLTIPYGVWSNVIGLKGKREALKAQSLRKASDILGVSVISNDVSDAILIAQYFIITRGLAKQTALEW